MPLKVGKAGKGKVASWLKPNIRGLNYLAFDWDKRSPSSAGVESFIGGSSRLSLMFGIFILLSFFPLVFNCFRVP